MGPWRKLVDNISGKLAFFPPEPSYHIVEKVKSGERVKQVSLDPREGAVGFEHSVCLIPSKKEEIVLVHIPYKRAGLSGQTELTLLCSHGNAVDLGQMLPIWRELSRLLKVSVVGYDYSGYGCSTGIPSVSQTFCDVQAVYDWLINEARVPANKIVLYGQSLGSGPSVWLAAQEPGVAGVVLHSPIMSGIRVLNPNLKWWPAWADVFTNHQLVPKIQAPVLIMHGTEDEVIHISCGQKLAGLVKNKYPPLWAQGYNHQNVESCPQYLPTLMRFLAHLVDATGRAPAG